MCIMEHLTFQSFLKSAWISIRVKPKLVYQWHVCRHKPQNSHRLFKVTAISSLLLQHLSKLTYTKLNNIITFVLLSILSHTHALTPVCHLNPPFWFVPRMRLHHFLCQLSAISAMLQFNWSQMELNVVGPEAQHANFARQRNISMDWSQK